MPRTPEQTAADDALTAAIERVIDVYYPSEDRYVLSEYVVVSCLQRFDGNGDSMTAIGTMHTRLKKRITDDDEG